MCRRHVENIVPDADHKGYTITARHWEPAHYLEATKKKEAPAKKTKGEHRDSDIGIHLLFGSAVGFALGVVATKTLLPMASVKFPELAEQIKLLQDFPLAVYFITLLVSMAVVMVVRSALPAKDKAESKKQKAGAASCMDIPPVGDNGRMVTIDEMRVGGSGSASVMRGETVEVETIRTKYVVNAAGCYSVRF